MAYTYGLDIHLAEETSSSASIGTGRSVRMFTAVGLAVYVAFAVTALIAVPGAVQGPVVWVPLATTLVVAAITLLVANRLQRS